MTAHSSTPLRPRSLVAAASLLLYAGCSAPPGSEGDTDDVPEFSGSSSLPGNNLPNNAAGNVNGNAPNGNATNNGSAATGAPNTGAPSPAPAGAGGSTSAPSSEPTGNSGIGLTPPANDPASGQNSGAGGSSMVGNEPGNANAAGSSFQPANGSAGSTSMPPSNENPAPQNPPPANPPAQNPPAQNPVPQTPAANANCAGQFLCDGFETVAAGASPSAASWTIIEAFSERPASASVQVSADNAHGGNRALRVTGSGARTGVRATLPQKRYFVRAWLQVDAVPRGPVFIAGGTDQNAEVRLRIQGESFATINVVPGDAVRPATANGGGCPDCVTLRPNQWFCAEMFVDDATRSATLWIDDVEAASIVNGDGGFPAQPQTPALFLGSWGLQGGTTGIWIDDVVAGPNRIGCD